jgi:hypothetical protein
MAKTKPRRLIDPDGTLFATICERHATGETIASILRTPGMPSRTQFYAWLEDETRAERFARARAAAMDAIADEAMVIADDGANDTYTDDEGRTRTDMDVIQRSKLRVETRLKLLAKWAPKQYGDKLELAGDANAPLQVQIIRLSEGSK